MIARASLDSLRPWIWFADQAASEYPRTWDQGVEMPDDEAASCELTGHSEAPCRPQNWAPEKI